MIHFIERDLNEHLKEPDHYLNKIEDLGGIDSMEKYHMMNMFRIHVDEREIMEKNL